METIGIIAGNGRFPYLTLKEAHRSGCRVVVAGILNEAMPELQEEADSFEWVKVGQLVKLKKFFKSQGVVRALMAGKIRKVRLFQENVSPDFDMMKVVMKLKDFKDDSLLGGIADYLGEEGIELIDSTTFLKKEMPGAGTLGKYKPGKEIMEDIRFGFSMAKSIAGLDIGQTVVVKRKAVLAVEAIEGTDEAIFRAGKLGRDKIVAVKVSKPDQDMRFDVPAVGLQTIDALVEAKASAFAFEADKTLFIDLQEVIKKADSHKIILFGYSGQENEQNRE